MDGLDYVPPVGHLFVTDQNGANDVVIDATTERVVTEIPVGSGAGNTRFDPATDRVVVAVGSSNTLVSIDARSLDVVGR